MTLALGCMTKSIKVLKIDALDEGVIQERHLDPISDFSVATVGELDIPIQNTKHLFRTCKACGMSAFVVQKFLLVPHMICTG